MPTLTSPPYLFDLDGTLVDSLPDIAASTNHLRAHFGLSPVESEAVRGMVGDGMMTLLRHALADAGLRLEDEAVAAEATAVYRDHYADQCIRLTLPYPGVTTCLARWHEADHPMAVVTNKPVAFARTILDHLELSAYLPVVVGGDSLPVRKPDPAPVHLALKQLEVAPASSAAATMVGDSVGDILAGRRAGIRTAAALFGYQPESDLREAKADEYWSGFGVIQAQENRA